MNRTDFEFLYIHANCLAELAIDQLALDLDCLPPDPPSTETGREEQALALLSQMDMAASVDGWKGGAEFEAQVLRGIEELKRADLAPSAPDPSVPGERDLAVYLQRAYAASGQLAGRVDDGMARLDLARLDRLLAALPVELAPLTQALGEAGLAQWLACYQAGHAALDDIVALVRALDTAA